MLRIDAHQHFWLYDPLRHDWINEDMKVIQRDFLPRDLAVVLKENKIDGCVAVQADQTIEETHFLLTLAEKNNFIKAVVGWVDLSAGNITEQLSSLSHYKTLKGFRHILQAEKQDDYMLYESFCNGIKALKAFDYTYDILVFPRHLQFVKQFVSKFPDQRLVIDHLAKPDIKHKNIDEWKKDMKALASFPNIHCKLSGMVTEADWKTWQPEDFHPYLDVVVNAFGTGRVMFGSDWPVCLVAGSYDKVVNIVEQYTASFSENEKQKIFGGNAAAFYKISA
jgi:L-fuconolactonase